MARDAPLLCNGIAIKL